MSAQLGETANMEPNGKPREEDSPESRSIEELIELAKKTAKELEGLKQQIAQLRETIRRLSEESED
jgi:hypothetical protein